MAPRSPLFSMLPRAELPTLAELPSGVYVLDDSNTTSISYTLPFLQVSNSTCYGGTCTELLGPTGLLEFNFTGTDVWLFGKPGGIARIFLDGTLVDVLDSSSIPNDGRALWTSNNLSQTAHSFKVAGVQGDGLNLLIDFFGIDGTVASTSSNQTDSSSTSPSPSDIRKLTGIIVGTLIAFIGTLILVALCVFLYRRRRKARASNGSIKSGFSKPSSFFSKRRSFRKPIVLLRRRSTQKVSGLTPFNATYPSTKPSYPLSKTPPPSYPSSFAPQFDQRSLDQSIPRFIIPESPPMSRPTIVIPDHDAQIVIPKLSPGQYLLSKLPWANTARTMGDAFSSARPEETPLMTVSSRYLNFPQREMRDVSEQNYNTTTTGFANTNAFLSISSNHTLPPTDSARKPLAPRKPIREESFGTIASSVISSPPPNFMSTFSPPETTRALPPVPDSAARRGPYERPFEDLRLMQEDRYGWREGLDQWNQLGGVKLAREGPESPLDPHMHIK